MCYVVDNIDRYMLSSKVIQRTLNHLEWKLQGEFTSKSIYIICTPVHMILGRAKVGRASLGKEDLL